MRESNGSRIVIECQCETRVIKEVFWYKEEILIKNEGRYLIDVDESHAPNFVIILEIDGVNASDEGKYKCVAKNAKGESSTVIEIKLEGKPEEKKPAEKKPEPPKAEPPKQQPKQPEIKVEAPAAKSNEVAASFKEKPKDQVHFWLIFIFFCNKFNDERKEIFYFFCPIENNISIELFFNIPFGII